VPASNLVALRRVRAGDRSFAAGFMLRTRARDTLPASAVKGGEVTLLESLGFAPAARVVVIHVDDVGLCSAANQGWLRASTGAATCGSVMVPCSGFEELVEQTRGDHDADLGIHLTLNCEYEIDRWRPLRDDVPSLCAPDGGMWRTSAETIEHAATDEVERELRAQIERALEHGIDVTHIDAHMGTVFHLRFVEIYLRLAREFAVPMFLPRIERARLLALGMPDAIDRYVALIQAAADEGFPTFDHFDTDSLHFPPGTGLEHNLARLRRLGPGLSYLITHCCEATDAFGGLSGGAQRAEECDIYAAPAMQEFLAREDIQTTGMRPLRDWLRRRIG